MSAPEKESPRSPEHAKAQCNRILDAAEFCFIKYGFHAASMASIAQTAEISQGLAYRYFKNKSAIILAIIERQLNEGRFRIEEPETSEAFAQRLMQWILYWQDQGSSALNPVLFLEMSAESSRDPDISEALRGADKLYLEDFTRRLRHIAALANKDISAEEIESRFYALQCMVEGMVVKAARRPHAENGAINKHIAKFITELLTVE